MVFRELTNAPTDYSMYNLQLIIGKEYYDIEILFQTQERPMTNSDLSDYMMLAYEYGGDQNFAEIWDETNCIYILCIYK